MTVDTAIGGPCFRFPQTQRSVIAGLDNSDAALRSSAFEKIVAAYWKPAYKHIRLRWKTSNEDAKDLAQGFFTSALDKAFFAGFDPEKGTFRTYLRTCLDRFVANERQSARRLKRGGGMRMVPLDFEGAERELALSAPAPEDCFQKEWVRSQFELAIAALRQRCELEGKHMQFRVFEKYDLSAAGERITYDQLAREFGVPPTTITNYLAAMRRDLRRLLLENLRQITSSEREFRHEARRLLGIEI
jgi:RNA polymerase sigma factor (sigma-70 family)